MKSVSAVSSCVSWLTSRREVDRNGLKYSADRPACLALPSYWVAKPWMTRCRSLRAAGSSALNTWSRSTTSVVEPAGSVASSSSSSALFGAGRERDVAVGDARQRGEPDDRGGALAQRRVGLLDLHADARAVVVGQRDLAHRADAAAADLHVVVLDELAGVLEHEVVPVDVAAAEQQHRDEHDRKRRARRAATPRASDIETLVLSQVRIRAVHGVRPCGRGKLSRIRLLRVTRPRVIPCPAGRAMRRRGTGGRTCCPS